MEKGERVTVLSPPSTRQAPAFREKGLPGEECEIRLELRVLSDVGLVGLPNAGKSSLLATMSAARPKVGAYPFTTPDPEARCCRREGLPGAVCSRDIPGLIEGASEGRGLGNQFLRHVARARVLALVLDAAEDPEGAEGVLRAELYAAGLSQKPTVVALNKADLLDEELREYLAQEFPGACQVSAKTGEGVEEFRDLLEEKVRELGVVVAKTNGTEEAHRTFRPTWRGMRVESRRYRRVPGIRRGDRAYRAKNGLGKPRGRPAISTGVGEEGRLGGAAPGGCGAGRRGQDRRVGVRFPVRIV